MAVQANYHVSNNIQNKEVEDFANKAKNTAIVVDSIIMVGTTCQIRNPPTMHCKNDQQQQQMIMILIPQCSNVFTKSHQRTWTQQLL